METPAGISGDGKPGSRNDLVGAERCGEVGDEEVIDGDPALAVGAEHEDVPSGGEGDGSDLRGGIRVRE